jgi:hypothetical protein
MKKRLWTKGEKFGQKRKFTGSKIRSVFDRYNIVSEGDLRDAAARLDQFSQKINGIRVTETEHTRLEKR